MFETIARSADVPFGLVLHRGGEGRPGVIWLHGKGNKGDGSTNSLQNMLTNGGIPANLQKGVQNGRLWLLAPQISDNYSSLTTISMFAYIEAHGLPVDLLKMNYSGFSMGAGEILRFLCESLANAQKFATALIIAPTGFTPNQNIAQAKVACWFHHYSGDDVCPVSNTNSAVTKINEYNPPVKAVKTIYNINAHGGVEPATSLLPPNAPGGQGLTASKVNYYEWIEMNKQGFPIAVPEIVGLYAMAGVDRTVTDPKVHLDGMRSANYVKAGWDLVGFPEGVNKWEVIKSGGGWIEADAVLPKPGAYTFRLTVTDAANKTASDDIIITYNADGSTEPPPTVTKEMKQVSIDMVNKSVSVGFNDNSTITIKNDGTQS